MRIKHWSGYGCVDAKKIDEGYYGDSKVVTVQVKGNHERGLDRPFHDPYCIEKWLGRFCKGWKMEDYRVIVSGYSRENNLDTEILALELWFRKEN